MPMAHSSLAMAITRHPAVCFTRMRANAGCLAAHVRALFFHCRNLAITCAQPIRRAAFGRIPVLSARGGPCGLAQSSAPLAVASLTARVFALGKRLADKMWGAPTYWAGRWQRPGKCLPWLSPPSGSVRRTPAVGPRGTGDEESTSITPLMQRRSTF